MKGTGVAYAWLLILVIGWVVTFMWIIFTTITVEHLYPWATTMINNSESQEILDHQINYHNWWPILLMVGLTVFGIASSLKAEPTTQYYGP